MALSKATSAAAVEYYSRISSQQANAKRQAAELETAAEKVEKEAKNFTLSGMFELMYETDKESSAFRSYSMFALTGLVKSYNQLNDSSNSSSALSNEGKSLLDNVKALLTGSKASAFQEIGLAIDKHSGAILFDERIFADKVTNDPKTVRNVLIDEKMLGPVMRETISAMLSKPTTAYFTSLFSVKV